MAHIAARSLQASWKLQDNYDLIISSESGPAKGIHNPTGIPHLCYVHTPMRYCWGFEDQYTENLPSWLRSFTKWQLRRLKEWDKSTINNVDHYLANSENVAGRLRDFYRKKSKVVYPPIALDLFTNDIQRQEGNHYLSFGAITPYKDISL